jgi:L-ascorbate metabolism protein UlaG (beta-lactamase superfamily)
MKVKDTIQLLRHATLYIQIAGLKLLIDPMLSSKEEMDPVQNCGNEKRIPMVDLPISKEDLNTMLKEADAVFVTHTHRDHWDAAAQQLIDKNKPVFCQPADEVKIKEQGFKNVTAIDNTIHWKGITIHRTNGQHGTGEIGRSMGVVSGFVFESNNKTIYVAGDSIWCDDVENALHQFKPGVTVLNAGGAQFLTGDPITMTPDDVIKVHEALPETRIIAVHMDTVNHCLVKRTDLAKALEKVGLQLEVMIPVDGEEIEI